MRVLAGRCGTLRTLLLVLVAIGVAGMHTLGHPSGHGRPASHSAMMMADQPPMAGEGVAAASRYGMDGTQMRLDPLTVCLAILAGGLLLFLAALLANYRRRCRPVDRIRAAITAAGRGPPGSAPFGLRLADLSVLRT